MHTSADTLSLVPAGVQLVAVPWCAAGTAVQFHGKLHVGGNLWVRAFNLMSPNF